MLYSNNNNNIKCHKIFLILLTFCRVFWFLRVSHHLPCLKYEALPLFSLMAAPFVCGNEWMLKDFTILTSHQRVHHVQEGAELMGGPRMRSENAHVLKHV